MKDWEFTAITCTWVQYWNNIPDNAICLSLYDDDIKSAIKPIYFDLNLKTKIVLFINMFFPLVRLCALGSHSRIISMQSTVNNNV